MKASALTYPSFDNKTLINAVLWQSADEGASSPRAIVQILHGAAEHIERYAGFANFLVDADFVVCAHDHIGHGKSLISKELLAHMPLKGGSEILIEDAHSLREQVQAKYPGTPYVMLGHSMGSFILRNYLAKHGDGLCAAILVGTNQQPAYLSYGGRAIAFILASFKGPAYRSKFLDSIGMGVFSKDAINTRTKLDWLSSDSEVVDAYIADELCGECFTVGAYSTVTELTAMMVKPECAFAVPKNLPMLILAGCEDSVGEKGKGPKAAFEQYKQAAVSKVHLRLYENMRHEILNEAKRQEVYSDILNFLSENC